MHYLKHHLGGTLTKSKGVDGRLTDREVCELDRRNRYECGLEPRTRHIPSADPRHQPQRHLLRRYPRVQCSHKQQLGDLAIVTMTLFQHGVSVKKYLHWNRR